MKSYLLTVIGNFDSEELCKEIAISITPIVDSPHEISTHQRNLDVLFFY